MQPLATILNTVCDEIGLPRPAQYISSVDPTARQLVALAQREGNELSMRPGAWEGWPILRKEYTFQIQSTGLITNCSYTSGSNIITIGTPPTQAPQVGWVLSISGGSNATGFPYPTTVTNVAGSTITVSSSATASNTNVSLAFGKESYSLPSDFQHFINQSQWDRGYRWQLQGSMSAQEWQVLKSGLSPTGPRRRFRIMGGLLYVDPIPYDSNTLVYEYYSNGWCSSSGGTPQSSWLADTDLPILPDDLFILGVKWRILAAKGMDYDQEYKTYEDMVQSIMGRIAGARILPLNNTSSGINLISNAQIPDTGFGA